MSRISVVNNSEAEVSAELGPLKLMSFNHKGEVEGPTVTLGRGGKGAEFGSGAELEALESSVWGKFAIKFTADGIELEFQQCSHRVGGLCGAAIVQTASPLAGAVAHNIELSATPIVGVQTQQINAPRLWRMFGLQDFSKPNRGVKN